MSVTSICQVCENTTARHTCGSCGAAVCEEHYRQGTGMCADCAGGTRLGDVG